MSYTAGQRLDWRSKSPVSVECDKCGSAFAILYKSAEKNRKKHGCHLCMKCTGQPMRPQNQAGFWTDEKRKRLGASITGSNKYQQAIKERDTSGESNGMFGKKLSKESRAKMSVSRTGKTGSRATAWKGGKCSITSRVKGIIHGRHNWYGKVYARDGWKCAVCGSKNRIDAHHIKPVSQIIKELCEGRTFTNDDDKIDWLVEQPEIIDTALENGITLCRKHHREHHERWGSHNAKGCTGNKDEVV